MSLVGDKYSPGMIYRCIVLMPYTQFPNKAYSLGPPGRTIKSHVLISHAMTSTEITNKNYKQQL